MGETRVWAQELSLSNDLHRAILYYDGARFERINQLLAEADALGFVVLASMNHDSLTAILVLHDYHAVLEIEVDSEGSWV